jgi:uncharacterized protein YegJ (DUF2314 family)
MWRASRPKKFRRRQFQSGGWLLLLAGGLLACSEKAPVPTAAHVPSGDVRNDSIFYSVVFYHAVESDGAAWTTASNLVQRFFPGMAFHADSSQQTNARPPYVAFEGESAPFKNFPVPHTEYFKYAGRGLSPEDVATVQQARQAHRLILVAPRDEAWKQGRKFTELASEYAGLQQAFIWDSATREVFTREAWRKARLESWPEDGLPDIRKQITIHLYRENDDEPYLRAITLGMEKFALPDVVIERVIGSDNRSAGNLINVFCQTLAENPVVANGARHDLQLEALKTARLKVEYEELLLDKAEKVAALELLRGKSQEGDPDNGLIEISFRHGCGKTEDERRESVLSRFWGAADSIKAVKHTDEILDASKRAREKLTQLRAPFVAGLKPGERLMVKGPFARDDAGKEWMWIEATKWTNAKQIEGILQNDPYYIRSLKAGTKVTMKVEDVFDFIFYHADGREEGNETGALLEKQSGAADKK